MKLSPVWNNYAYLKNQQTFQQVAVQNALEEAEERSTRGHSVLRRGTYGAPTPRRVYSDAFAPEYIPRRLGYESTAEEYALGSAVNSATSYSDASLYDTYDTANRSRGRDQALLQNATAAIAAIVASKVEVEPRRKRPRSKFAADKLRTTRARGEESVYPQATSGLSASRPPLRTPRAMPLPSDRRAIRDVEGFTKPRNLLSWQYRLESRMDPADLIYKPGSFSRMREQVRDAHDKMDRHRQLLDRYLTDSGPTRDIQGSVQRKMEELERRDPGPSQYGMPPKQPVSELRRRLRRTVCRSRGEPNYYRDRE